MINEEIEDFPFPYDRFYFLKTLHLLKLAVLHVAIEELSKTVDCV